MATAKEYLDSIIQQADELRDALPPRAVAPWVIEALTRIDTELDNILDVIEQGCSAEESV